MTMDHIGGHHGRDSIWLLSTESPSYPEIELGEEFDVVIVGAGIVGVLVAHQLKDKGLRVCIVEARSVLAGVTGFTTGKLTSQHGLIYHKVRESLGLEGARDYYYANESAKNQIRDYIEKYEINCDMGTADACVVAFEGESDPLEKEADTLREIGAKAEVLYEGHPLHGGSAQIRFPDQVYFHPRKFLLALLQECQEAGVEIYEHSRVTDLKEENHQVVVHFQDGIIWGKQVVMATHYPIHDTDLFIAKLEPRRSYAMAVRLNGEVPDEMVIGGDGEDMRSTRPAIFEGERVLVVGGGRHRVGNAPDQDVYGVIEEWIRSRRDVDSVVARWSTQDNWTPDSRPYVGPSPMRKRTFMATGFCGWGLTTGFVASQVLVGGLMQKKNRWAHLYSPDRNGIGDIPKIVSDGTVFVKHLVLDRLGRAGSLDGIQPGEAKIVDGEDGRVAVYRDDQGEVHAVSAICTHMGCQLSWNALERSWDCACHGSRFGLDGGVLHGPAVKPLAADSTTLLASDSEE